MTDWDRYAAQEYELLVAEEGGDTQGWVIQFLWINLLRVSVCCTQDSVHKVWTSYYTQFSFWVGAWL